MKHAPATGDAHSAVHIVPVRLLAGVLAALLILTGLTVAATALKLGALNIWLALLIATVKAALVILYFMHLRYDRPFHAVVLIGALFFVGVFISLAMLDVFQYRPDVETFRQQNPTQIAPQIEIERARLHPRP